MKRIILIPEELFNQISDIAADYSETPDEMVEHLLTAQVTRVLHEKTTMFYPGRKFENPKATVLAMMLESDLKRLRTWLLANNQLTLCPCENELIIINQSKQENPLDIEVKA